MPWGIVRMFSKFSGALIAGPARHLDASRQKLTPHCLAAIFDSQLPSPKLSLKMPPKLPLPHNRGHFSSFKIAPVVRVIARQLSGKNCLAAIFASRHQDASPGALFVRVFGFGVLFWLLILVADHLCFRGPGFQTS